MTLIYHGPVQHFSARVDGALTSIACHPGKALQLPEDHPIAQGMLARGLVKREAAPAAPKKATKSRTGPPADE